MTSQKEALCNYHICIAELLSEHRHTHFHHWLWIHNQVGSNPTKWWEWIADTESLCTTENSSKSIYQLFLCTIIYSPWTTSFLTPTPMTRLPSQLSLTALQALWLYNTPGILPDAVNPPSSNCHLLHSQTRIDWHKSLVHNWDIALWLSHHQY